MIVVEPALVAEHEQGLRELYVALTRPTQTLVVVHSRPLPAALRRKAQTRRVARDGGAVDTRAWPARSTTSSPASTAGSRPSRREHGVEAMVEVELSDGALHRLVSLSPEPGYGFLTLVPQSEEGEPQELIVPLGAVRQLTLSPAEPPHKIGFSLPSEPREAT